MAVSITTKFYETDTPDWHDIAKIVFTSPNMDSPNTAGVRSHILPGESPLALWYEDLSNMYREADTQFHTTDNFYSTVSGTLYTELDLNSLPTTVTFTDFDLDFETEVLKRCQGPSVEGEVKLLTCFDVEPSPSVYRVQGAEPLSALVSTTKAGAGASDESTYYRYSTSTSHTSYYMTLLTSVGKDNIVTTSYNIPVYDYDSSSYVFTATDVITSATYTDYGWAVDVVDTFSACDLLFIFNKPVNVYRLSMEGVLYRTYTGTYVGDTYMQGYTIWYTYTYNYTKSSKYAFFGNFSIYGSNDNENWTLLYTGSNTTSTTKDVYFENPDYYQYYKISILNNSTLNGTTFNTTKYGLKSLEFYSYTYGYYDLVDNPSYVYLYNFDNNYNHNVIVGSDLTVIDSNQVTSSGSQQTDGITGTVALTTISGTPYYSTYVVNLSSSDYNISYTCTATTVSGDGSGTSGTFINLADGFSTDISTSSCTFTTAPSGSLYLNINSSISVDDYIDTDIDYYTTTVSTYSFTTNIAEGSSTDGELYSISGTVTKDLQTVGTTNVNSYSFEVVEATVGSGTIPTGSPFYLFYQNESDDSTFLSPNKSVVFELTAGECYDCKLTAWDDVTHSTTDNAIIASDRARVDAVAYAAGGTTLEPTYLAYPDSNFVFPPVHNRILKGTSTGDDGYKYYYGDFDLQYRASDDISGDYLIFRPYLYNLDDTLSYGVHDYLITLMYSYT